MEKRPYILVQDFCSHHHLEIRFIQTLEACGIIEVRREENTEYLLPPAIERLEPLVRLHQELNIHVEDLDVVADLLDKLSAMQEELEKVQRQLDFYERQF